MDRRAYPSPQRVAYYMVDGDGAKSWLGFQPSTTTKTVVVFGKLGGTAFYARMLPSEARQLWESCVRAEWQQEKQDRIA